MRTKGRSSAVLGEGATHQGLELGSAWGRTKSELWGEEGLKCLSLSSLLPTTSCGNSEPGQGSLCKRAWRSACWGTGPAAGLGELQRACGQKSAPAASPPHSAQLHSGWHVLTVRHSPRSSTRPPRLTLVQGFTAKLTRGSFRASTCSDIFQGPQRDPKNDLTQSHFWKTFKCKICLLKLIKMLSLSIQVSPPTCFPPVRCRPVSVGIFWIWLVRSCIGITLNLVPQESCRCFTIIPVWGWLPGVLLCPPRRFTLEQSSRARDHVT